MDGIKIFGTVVGVVVAILSAFIGSVMTGSYYYDSRIGCPRFAANIERPYKYDFFGGGCFVQTTTGQWVAEKNYWNNPVLR